ncbi:XdhC/CoxI family protein [Streptomyces antimycoticus]|uniref:XdhC/CoxI family protein n=1 Tax=Streptomyces antimycoticus TaxID=68175 RepID=UPI00340E3B72|nr:XdhC family protein [Streptomyces antimycoticus]
MRDVVAQMHRWWGEGEPFARATVVATWHSSPLPPGTSMLVGPDGAAIGSVSGGCVEGAVYELAQEVTDSGRPVLERYGVSDDDAFAVGLTCGGIIDVYVERVDPEGFPELGEVATAVAAGEPVAEVICVAVDGPDPEGRLGRRLVVRPEGSSGSLGSARLDAAIAEDARGLLAGGRTETLRYGYDGTRMDEELTLFVSVHATPPRMLVFGAVDFAAAMARIGAYLGYHVTVCDARPVFATARRFPEAHEVVTDWPHRYLRTEAEAGRIDERTVVCVLTHDPKFDVPLLDVALRLPMAYVGAMGSRRTHDDRLRRLRATGLGEDALARLASPIGLDLGARTPEETAISIAAEIIADRGGGSGARLTSLSGSIHRPRSMRPAAGD